MILNLNKCFTPFQLEYVLRLLGIELGMAPMIVYWPRESEKMFEWIILKNVFFVQFQKRANDANFRRKVFRQKWKTNSSSFSTSTCYCCLSTNLLNQVRMNWRKRFGPMNAIYCRKNWRKRFGPLNAFYGKVKIRTKSIMQWWSLIYSYKR